MRLLRFVLSKSALIPLIIVFICTNCANKNNEKRLLQFDNFDIAYTENANPNIDLERNIEKGDLRFIAIQGVTVNIPGVDDEFFEECESYGYKTVKGSSDNIANYEQGRLNIIANHYAVAYNINLIKYIKSRKGILLYKNLSGYEDFSKIFRMKDLILSYNELELKFVPVRKQTIDNYCWINPFNERKELKYDWIDFLNVCAEINRTISKNTLLNKWKQFDADISLESNLLGLTPYPEENNKHITHIWKHSNLKGMPYCKISLRINERVAYFVFIGKEEECALVLNLFPNNSIYNLNKIGSIGFFVYPIPGKSQYIIVKP